MLEYNDSLVMDWEVLNMKRWEGQAGSIRFIGRLAKVTQLIGKAIDGLDKLNEEEVWSNLFIGGCCTINPWQVHN